MHTDATLSIDERDSLTFTVDESHPIGLSDFRAIQTATLSIDERDSLTFTVDESHPIGLSMTESIKTEGGPEWSGPYEVVPSVNVQVLETDGHFMRDDMTIREIPYFVVSNVSGGMTASIG